jgi:hypothetical protein
MAPQQKLLAASISALMKLTAASAAASAQSSALALRLTWLIAGPRYYARHPEPGAPRLRGGDGTRPVSRLCSGCVIFSKEAVGRVGFERRQSRIEAEPRPAIGTKDRVRRTHIDVDVRVVLRRGHANAVEFPHPDPDFRDPAVVPELRIVVGLRLALL